MYQNLSAQLVDWLNHRTEEQSAYLVALVGLLLLALATQLIPKSVISYLSVIPMVVLVYGFGVGVAGGLRGLLAGAITKIVWAVVIILGSTLSLALAKQHVNLSLNAPTNAFPLTVSLMTVLLSPLAASIIVGFIGLVLLPFSTIVAAIPVHHWSAKNLLLIFNRKGNSGVSVLTLCGRVGAYIIILGVCWGFNGNNAWYTEPLSDFAKWFAFHYDAEQYSVCSRDKEAKIAVVSGRYAIEAQKTEEGYQFRQITCPQQLTPIEPK